MTAPPLPEPVAVELAPRRQFRWRTRLFQVYLVLAIVGFGALLALAVNAPYLAIDPVITLAIQRYEAGWFQPLMRAVSWPGFSPQTIVVTGLLCGLVFALGLRWEAVCAGLAALGASGASVLIKLSVHRPRPTADLVSVFEQLDSYSFPSGHVLFYLTFFGFLWFLVYTLLKHSLVRSLLLMALGALVALVGVSRIALGQHWFSDVLAAYLLGSVLLALTVGVYRWGRERFFVGQV